MAGQDPTAGKDPRTGKGSRARKDPRAGKDPTAGKRFQSSFLSAGCLVSGINNLMD